MSGEWIPVTERLPGEDIPHGFCLVTDGTHVGAGNYCHINEMWYLLEERDEWQPTHWMPLPAPPTDAK